MSCKFGQHDANMNALQHSMAPPPAAHAPPTAMNYMRSRGPPGMPHKDYQQSTPHYYQQRQQNQHQQQHQPQHQQHQPQYNYPPQQRYNNHHQQNQQQQQPTRYPGNAGYPGQCHGNQPQQQQSQHFVSNSMSYRDNSSRSQSPRPQPQVVRLPPINFEEDPPSPDNGRYDNDRIQNDLLDEICSDIGIKDAIDLDMFDFDVHSEQYVVQPTRLPDDLDSLDQTIPFSAMSKQEDVLVPEGAMECLSAPQYPQQSSQAKVSGSSAVQRSANEESIASPTISSSSNSNKANAGSSRPSSVSSADSPAAVHSTTSSSGSASDKAESDTKTEPSPSDQCTSDDQKALMCPGFLQRLATDSPHEASSPNTLDSDVIKVETPQKQATNGPASPFTTLTVNAKPPVGINSPYKSNPSENFTVLGEKPPLARSLSQPQRALSSPFDPGYFSIGSPSACTANSQYGSSNNLSTTTAPTCSEETSDKVMRFLNQASGADSGSCALPDGISASGTCSALTSKSNSPTGAPAKRPRIISNGCDLLEEMRERYSFTKGANMYAKPPTPGAMPPPPVQRPRMFPSNQPSTATSPTPQQLSSCQMATQNQQQTFNFGHTATGFGGNSNNDISQTNMSQDNSFTHQLTQDLPPPPGVFPSSCIGSLPRPASIQSQQTIQQPASPACMANGPSGMYGSCPDLSPPRGQGYSSQQQMPSGYNSPQQPQASCYSANVNNNSSHVAPQNQASFSAPNTPSKHHPQSQPQARNFNSMGGQLRQNLMRMYPPTPNQHPQQQQQQGGSGMLDNQCMAGGMETPEYRSQMDPSLHSPHHATNTMPPPAMQHQSMNPQQQQLRQHGSDMMPQTMQNGGSDQLPNLPQSSLSHGFMQHLINDRSSAFRSHPLFPLLRDLIIADMNFHSPSFPFALIANLPSDFDRLLQNYLARNPPLANHQSNDAVQSVIMDALKYAHSALIEKIQCRKVKEGYDGGDKPLSAIEDFCERFDRAVKNTMKPERDVGAGMPPPNVTAMPNQPSQVGGYPAYPRQPHSAMAQHLPPHQSHQPPQQQPQQQHHQMMQPPPGYSHLDHFGFPGERRSQSLPPSPARKPLAHPFLQAGGMAGGGHMMAGSDFNIHMSAGKRSHDQTHSTGSSGKNKVLPKEAVQLMLDWLRQHQDNPYPNDDEKEMLINKTKLTINQINYWFTNARRRILPKWALQRYMEQQEKQKETEKKKTQEADSPPPLVGSTKAS